ncbi:hypothetical protein DRQ09_02450 [candidate division KSB1 bacterium]|nr:MAG: hypothetical protein DRQ09_02450 [candidate division KSB1 bacterium]
MLKRIIFLLISILTLIPSTSVCQIRNEIYRRVKKSVLFNRTSDLSISSYSISDYTHYVRTNRFLLRFNSNEPSIYKIEQNGFYVVYKPVNPALSPGTIVKNSLIFYNVWKSTDIILTPYSKGLKEYIIVKDGGPLEFSFQIISNLKFAKFKDTVRFFKDRITEPVFYIPRLTAFDSEGNPVPITFKIGHFNELYFINIKIDTAGVSYPVKIDPSTCIWSESDIEDAVISQSNSTANWGTVTVFYYFTGKWSTSGPFRYLIKFPAITDSIPSNATIDSAKLSLYYSAIGDYDESVFFSMVDTPWVETEVCWDSAQSGQQWSGGSWRTYAYSDTITFNHTQSGWYSFRIDTFIADIVHRVYPNHGFIARHTDSESGAQNVFQGAHSEYTADPSLRPKLEVWFTTPPFADPWDDTLFILNDTQAVLQALDSNLSREGFWIVDSSGFLVHDTILFGGTGGIDTIRDTLNVPVGNKRVGFKFWTFDSFGNTGQSEVEYAWTYADIPEITVIDTSETTLTITFIPDSNLSNTYYYLYDSTFSVYIEPGGESSGYFQQFVKSAWDTFTISYYSPNIKIIFKAQAKNNDSIWCSPFIDSLWTWAEVPDIDTAYIWSKDSIYFVIDPGNNPEYTYYSIQDSLSGYFFDVTTKELRGFATVDSSWAWGTFTDWGDSTGVFLRVKPSTRYILRVYSKDGDKK